MGLLQDLIHAAPQALHNVINAPKTFYYDAPKQNFTLLYNSLLNTRAGAHPIDSRDIIDPARGDLSSPLWPHPYNPNKSSLRVTPSYNNRFLPMNQQTQPFGQPLEDSFTALQRLQPTNYNSGQTSLNGQLTQGPMSSFYKLRGY